MSVFLCLGRSDRYNHEVSDGEDTEDDTDDSMFHSFTACSPRYSKVYMKFEELKEVREEYVVVVCL